MLFITISTGIYQNIEDNLFLHYAFNDSLEDASSNGYDGTNFGAGFTQDRFGNENGAALFDGVNDDVNFPNMDVLKPNLPISFTFGYGMIETFLIPLLKKIEVQGYILTLKGRLAIMPLVMGMARLFILLIRDEFT